MPQPAVEPADLERAAEAVKLAQLALQDLVKAAYPVGTELKAELGGHVLHLKVTGHNRFYGAGAGELHGVNLKTGKPRCFHFSQVIREHD